MYVVTFDINKKNISLPNTTELKVLFRFFSSDSISGNVGSSWKKFAILTSSGVSLLPCATKGCEGQSVGTQE